jgi:hypothetical protein
MDKGTKDKLVESVGENGGRYDAQKSLHLRNWKERNEGEGPGKDGEK